MTNWILSVKTNLDLGFYFMMFYCIYLFISQEYQSSDYPKLVSVKKSVKDDTENMEEIIEERKKRVAHPSAATSVTRQIGPSQLPKKHTNPYQKMCERWHLMKKAAAEKAAEKATEKAATDMKTQTISTLIDHLKLLLFKKFEREF